MPNDRFSSLEKRLTNLSMKNDKLDKFFFSQGSKLDITRKYLLRGYILGVLTHTTALDRLGGGDETLKCRIIISLGESISGYSDLVSGILTMWFKIEYTHLGFASARAV